MTAYEMRIIDWSSDVCSSALLCLLVHGFGLDRHTRQCGGRMGHRHFCDRHLARRLALGLCRGARAADDRDRKSVVSGKSVSVRVDLGGRGIFKIQNDYV